MGNEASYRLIHRYTQDQGLSKMQDLMVEEKSVALYINGEYSESLLCNPLHLNELGVGHLFLSGRINSIRDLVRVETIDGRIMAEIQPNSVFGEQLEIDPGTYYAEQILVLMEKHLSSSQLHTQTGGVHLMSLASNNELLVTREDIGRHNAVDKLYGYCLLNEVECRDKVFLSSGRISNEIIQKLAKMGIKVAVSRAAVTTMAQEVAERCGITVIGFARGKRFNIYSHPERVRI